MNSLEVMHNEKLNSIKRSHKGLENQVYRLLLSIENPQEKAVAERWLNELNSLAKEFESTEFGTQISIKST